MKRIIPSRLLSATAFILVALGVSAGAALATPNPNSATIHARVFNDCPVSTLTITNSYPASIVIDDAGLACAGFANLHTWHFSENGINDAVFNNPDEFEFSADLVIDGVGNMGEAGLRLSPWYSPDVDGRFNCRIPDGEIACFGGRLPFYSFTGSHGLLYVKGTTIRLGIIYKPNGLSMASPATIEYTVRYNSIDYTSGPLAFDEGNASEDPPHGVWGIGNPAYAGGFFQPRLVSGDFTNQVRATFSTIRYCAEPPSVMGLELKPHKLNLNSKAKWVTGYLTPTSPYTAAMIDVSSIRLNGTVPVAAGQATKIENHGATLKVKFDRAAVNATLTAGDDTVTVTGLVAGACFEGADIIKVKAPNMSQPLAGTMLSPGAQADVRWETFEEDAGASATLFSTFDDGATWNVEAEGLSNTGSYRWTVPSVNVAQARLAVVLVYGNDETGPINESEFAESGTFSINSALAVEPGSDVFALRGVTAAGRQLNVSFSLANSARASLSLYDVSGRQLAAREVGSLGAGQHTVALGKGTLPAGVYLVQIRQGEIKFAARAVVID